MTGVLEVAAAASAIAAFARSRHEKERTEEKVAADLYARFFHADLLDVSPDRASTTSSERFQNLDANAAAAVRAIERYQKERKRWFLWMSSSSEQTGDTRTRVLEEMKLWFLRVSDGGSIGAVEVSTRLDYCWQFLLHSSSFEGHNQTSFLGTLAEVCRNLERMFQQTAATQRTSEAQIGQVLALGRQLVDAALPALLFSLPCPSSSSSSSATKSCTDDPPALGQLLSMAAAAATAGGAEVAVEQASGPREAAASQECVPQERGLSIAWHSDVGRLLQALLRGEHVARLGASDEDVASSNPTLSSAGTHGSLATLLEEIRAGWRVGEVSGEGSGLLGAFCRSPQQQAREAYINMLEHLDSVCFFIGALHPYRRVAGVAGDAALCWLRRGLGHLLQELERALVQLRQARLEVMRAAKRQLQELSKRLPAESSIEFRWMQGLRHVDELQLDKLHQALVSLCVEVRASASAAREVELKAAAQQGLKSIAFAFMSTDFQARCSLALPEKLACDMRELATGPGHSEAVPSLRDV